MKHPGTKSPKNLLAISVAWHDRLG
jgi:hypothetical protein